MTSKKSAPKVTKDFGRRLQACRIAAGYATQEAFAARLGKEAPAYRRWERGETAPSMEELIQLSIVLDKSLDFLIRGITRQPPKDPPTI